MSEPTPAGETELADVVSLITAEQALPERHIPYLGDQPDGIVAELDGLGTPWASFLRIGRDGDGKVAAAAFADIDEEMGRAWVHGPWVRGDADQWNRWARPLIEAVVGSLPRGIDDFELSGDTRNLRLSALATEMGYTPSEVNWVYTLELERAATWPEPGNRVRVRRATAGDAEDLATLHDAEFPATYLTVDRMLSEAVDGDRTALVAVDASGRVVGYATGDVQPDGNGYIDFLAVEEAARGGGVGPTLVAALVQALRPSITAEAVHLTVQDHRAPARALYDKLGFHQDIGIVGYRRR